MYLALFFLLILAYDVWNALWFEDAAGKAHFGMGLGTLLLALNVCLLGGYTMGCHSFRHLVGGWRDEISKAPGGTQSLRLRELPEQPAYGLGLVQPLLRRVLRYLRTNVQHGDLARLANLLMIGKKGSARGAYALCVCHIIARNSRRCVRPDSFPAIFHKLLT